MLMISLSRNGLKFDGSTVIRFVSAPTRYQGKFKSRGYQYPHSVVVGEHLRLNCFGGWAPDCCPSLRLEGEGWRCSGSCRRPAKHECRRPPGR